MFDIGGFLNSDQFIAQIALILVTLFSTVFSSIVGNLFGTV